MTDSTVSPAFAIATPSGPATLTLVDRDNGVGAADANARQTTIRVSLASASAQDE